MRARIFPGQGVQRRGMGKEMFELFPELTERASAVLGYSISELCIEDPAGRLTDTRYVQPAVFFVNALLHEHGVGGGAEFDVVAGHSLGEYNALVAAGSLELFEALAVVQARAAAMATVTGGAMLAVSGMGWAEVESVLRAESVDGVHVANCNSDAQVTIAGAKQQMRPLARAFKLAGATKVTPVNVSGPFHTPLMAPAQEILRPVLDALEPARGRCPVISSVTGRELEHDDVRRVLIEQITTPVRWTDTVRTLRSAGATAMHEVHGTTLTSMIRDISDDIRIA